MSFQWRDIHGWKIWIVVVLISVLNTALIIFSKPLVEVFPSVSF
jgi:hypothetical protein